MWHAATFACVVLYVRWVMVIAFWALHGNGVTRLDAMQVQDGVVLVALWV